MRGQPLKTILLKSTLVTLATVIASVGLAATIVPMLGGVVDGNAWLMCVLCPLLTAWPASTYTFWQSARLRSAHEALATAHRDLERLHRRLEAKARSDSMTGLLNREAFYETLEAARGRTNRGAVLIVDADHFKILNDTHGHIAGDEALVAIASAINRAVRFGDAVARIGGEEFAVFIPAAGHGEAQTIAERVRTEVERIVFTAGGKAVPLSVSVGGARCPPDADVTEIMRAADRRLYEAKGRGRNRVVLERISGAAA